MSNPPSAQFARQLFQQATEAYAAGQRAAAVALAKRVLQLQSDHVGALFLIGGSALDDNQAAQALPYLEAAARLDAKHPDIQRALGATYLNLGQWAPAVDSLRCALERYPQDSGLLNNLGIAYKELGEIEAAVQCYRRAISFNQNDADIYNNLGIALDKQRQYEAAIDAYHQSVALHPRNPAIWSNLATLLEQGNRIQEAEAAVNHGLSIAPQHAGLNLVAAKCARRRGDPGGAIRRLEAILENAQPRAIARRAIGFELGRDYDAVGDATTAFQHFKTANQLTTEIWPEALDQASAFTRELEQLLECFTASWANTWIPRTARSQLPEPYPLTFLVGFLRTGSTLMDTLLGARPGVAVLEEEPCLEHTLNRIRRTTPPYPRALAELDAPTWSSLRADYWTSVSDRLSNTSRPKLLLDKNPLMSAHAGYIHALFPDARFLFALRHPCDVILSCYMQTFDGSSVRANFLSLQSSARTYDRVMRLWRRYCEIFKLQVHELRYESLATDPQPTVDNALEFMGGQGETGGQPLAARIRGRIYTPSYHQVGEPVNTRAVDRWRHYSSYFGEAMETLQPWIEHFGYTA